MPTPVGIGCKKPGWNKVKRVGRVPSYKSIKIARRLTNRFIFLVAVLKLAIIVVMWIKMRLSRTHKMNNV